MEHRHNLDGLKYGTVPTFQDPEIPIEKTENHRVTNGTREYKMLARGAVNCSTLLDQESAIFNSSKNPDFDQGGIDRILGQIWEIWIGSIWENLPGAAWRPTKKALVELTVDREKSHLN